MTNKIKYVSVVIILLFIIFKLFFHEKVSSSDLHDSVIVDQPYINSLRNLMSKDSFESIARKNNAEIVDKEWKKITIKTPTRLLRFRDYEVSGRLFFRAKVKDDFLGEMTFDFYQDVDFDKKVLEIKCYMLNNEIGVLSYERIINVINMEQEEKTKIDITNMITIKKTIPFFADDMMQKMLDEYNKKEMDKVLEVLLDIIKKEPSIQINLKD